MGSDSVVIVSVAHTAVANTKYPSHKPFLDKNILFQVPDYFKS